MLETSTVGSNFLLKYAYEMQQSLLLCKWRDGGWVCLVVQYLVIWVNKLVHNRTGLLVLESPTFKVHC